MDSTTDDPIDIIGDIFASKRFESIVLVLTVIVMMRFVRGTHLYVSGSAVAFLRSLSNEQQTKSRLGTTKNSKITERFIIMKTAVKKRKEVEGHRRGRQRRA